MIRIPSHLWRLFRTGATFERTGAMVAILNAAEIRGWQRFAIRAFARPFGLFGRAGNPDLPPLPRALQAMGPAYVKFGQALSVEEARAQRMERYALIGLTLSAASFGFFVYNFAFKKKAR